MLHLLIEHRADGNLRPVLVTADEEDAKKAQGYFNRDLESHLEFHPANPNGHGEVEVIEVTEEALTKAMRSLQQGD